MGSKWWEVPSGLLIDDRGRPRSADARGLADYVRRGELDANPVVRAVKDFGFVFLREGDTGTGIWLRAGGFSLLTLTSTLFMLADRRPSRILLAAYSEEEWSYELFSDLGSFAERAEDLAAGKRIVDRSPWLAVPRDITSLRMPQYHRFLPVARLWRDNRGSVSDELEHMLKNSELLSHSTLARQHSSSSSLTIEHYGSGSVMLRPCEGLLAVGRDLRELPDRPYGAWITDGYNRAISDQRIKLENVRAQFRTSQNRTIRTRYDRILLPWRGRGGESLVLSITANRKILMVA
jgi:hypothetical protein